MHTTDDAYKKKTGTALNGLDEFIKCHQCFTDDVIGHKQCYIHLHSLLSRQGTEFEFEFESENPTVSAFSPKSSGFTDRFWSNSILLCGLVRFKVVTIVLRTVN